MKFFIRGCLGLVAGLLSAVVLSADISVAKETNATADQGMMMHVADDGPFFIRGTVTSADNHPELGVWVIAETAALPTPFRKIVVTDDRGRFLVPDLPSATYRVWVRGYGLKDSQAQTAVRGADLALRVEVAATAQEAAMIYPASYWLSMLELPGAAPDNRAQWSNSFKLGCQLCHQVGSLITRTKSGEMLDQGLMKATYMHATADGLKRPQLLAAMNDWTRRIAAGEVPQAPARPQGIERNLVITQWNWGDSFTYAHDEIATDKRNPSLYPYGPIYGVDLANDRLLALDPLAAVATSVATPTRDGFSTPWCTQTYASLGQDQPISVGFGSLGCPVKSGITGFEGRYPNPANPHNPMMDDQGRVWITTQIRREWAADLPEFCQRSPVIVNNYHHRQLGWFDPKTQQYQLIDTCYGTHHLQFDAQGILWVSGDSYVLGWFDPSKFDPTKPETLEAAQGFAEVVIDTDGDGKKDTPIVGFNYGVIPNPLDGSVWTAQPGGDPGGAMDYRGRIVRYEPAADKFESYTPPKPGSGPRGVDVDRSGVIWVALGGSGHLAKFDRRQCKQTWGGGDQCPEGWTLYRSPGPLMRTGGGAESEQGADFHYYLFVDQFNTLGMGNDVVVINGTGSDALLAFDPKAEKFTIIRVPYPLNTYTRGLDGRIDDANGGWKGRGLWFTNGLDPIIHSEMQQSYVGQVQLRPSPLAE